MCVIAKRMMATGDCINAGKALFNYCSADGTFIFSSLSHTQQHE